MTGAGPPIMLVVVCGPTAAGKTALALELARHWPLEAISADSRQVYRGMDIGTAKASAEEQARLRHHLIDVVAPDEDFSAANFHEQGRAIIADIHARGLQPLVVGGTGLYIRALTEGLLEAPAADEAVRSRLHRFARDAGRQALWQRLANVDPEAAAHIHPNNEVRVVRALEVFELTGQPISELQRRHAFADRPYRLLKLGLCPPLPQLMARIDARVEQMLAAGLLEETSALLKRGYSPELKSLGTLGYREAVGCLRGELGRDQTCALIQQRTRQYAKRQLTWFKNDPEIIWVDSWGESDKILGLIGRFYSNSLAQRSGYGQDPV